jgi:hypothetical protein
MAYDWTQDDDCVGAWLFTEGSGTTVADASGISSAASFVGDPEWYSTDLPESYMKFGVDLDGNDGVNCGSNSALDNLDNFTYSTWANFDSLKAIGQESNMIAKASSGKWQKQFYVMSGGFLGFFCNGKSGGGAQYKSQTGMGVISTGSWYHLAYVAEVGEKGVLYKDGAAQTNSVVDNVVTANTEDESSANLTIGYRNTENYVEGKMAETGIFEAPLDSTDINDIMDNGLKQSAVASRRMLMGVG